MKLGVMTLMFASLGKSLEETPAYLKTLDFGSVELATGGYLGCRHASPAELLAEPSQLAAIKGLVQRHGMEISNLAVHSNQLHPNKETFAAYKRDLENTIRLASKLGVRTVATFSGCPADCPEGKNPNWVSTPFPNDFPPILDYQWNEVAIPYWKQMAAFAGDHGVRIGIEMFPGMLV